MLDDPDAIPLELDFVVDSECESLVCFMMNLLVLYSNLIGGGSDVFGGDFVFYCKVIFRWRFW